MLRTVTIVSYLVNRVSLVPVWPLLSVTYCTALPGGEDGDVPGYLRLARGSCERRVRRRPSAPRQRVQHAPAGRCRRAGHQLIGDDDRLHVIQRGGDRDL